MPFELGILTFGELTTDLSTGTMPSPVERMEQTLEQARLADEVGLDVFGVGEHHRSDFIASAPHMVLAAAAAQTERIRLTSGVTVLSSEDPVRVFQHFATLDLISHGRAEMIAGRGSYTESFPLFGYSLDDYAALFREKLDLLLAIRAENPVTWSGSLRPPLRGADIAPRPIGELPIWVGVGGTPASAIRTGQLGLPMALALLLGPITQFTRPVDLYRRAASEAGHDPAALRVSINAHGLVGRTSQSARDDFFPYFRRGLRENNHQRGAGFDIPRTAFDAQATPGGGLLVGSPQEVIDKLLTYHELYGVTRAVFQMGFGGLPQREHLEAIERLGTEVAPVVRRELRSEQDAA
ncbi:probable oxidoreductase, LLM family [Rathayibacter oskolensis]|uniref:Probable oxidoreductase, LLM family n=1 Tax=Rathayibacter oskolensis TaxID=1891671 RepID=A0A1X7PK41_9MICO|nr:LLM class flavin-dependent oxidoreductase [Rathayibacter oskolensis]SMH51062.1 probable oxidoreductase, LLM family [Rathayibacter oskolensis]